MLNEPVPVFSVFLLCYNNCRYAKDSLDSILTQDYPNIEIIFIDDFSEQFDKKNIESYIYTHKGDNIKNFLVYQNQMNLGTVRSINNAMKVAKGVYYKFLAVDDKLHDSTVLSKAKTSLDISPTGIVVSKVVKCNPLLQPIKVLNNSFQANMNEMTTIECYKHLCIHNDLNAPGVFFCKAFFDKWGDFDENYHLLEDWPTWLKVFRQGERVVYTNFISVDYRSNVGSATGVNNIYLKDKDNVYKLEIKPYVKIVGPIVIIKSWIMLHLRGSVIVRRLYALFFR